MWKLYSSDAHSELVKLLCTCEEKLRETKKIYAKDLGRFDEMEAVFLDMGQSDDNMFAADGSEFMHEYNNLQKNVTEFHRLSSLFNEQKELVELILEEGESDVELWRQCQGQLEVVLNSCETMQIKSKMTEDEDNCSAIFLEVNAGAGGDDANDWALMLLNMYSNFFSRDDNAYYVAHEDVNAGNGAGRLHVKSNISDCETENSYLYGLLKHEHGIHRLVRLSPFDTKKRRHTSFASVSVYPNNVSSPSAVEILPSDLKIDTFKASGAGGQHVNTTDSAVRVTHLPTNIVITCQKERSQHQNKKHAISVLKSKLLRMQLDSESKGKKDQHHLKEANSWGSHFRSYVMHPYTQVKDHRSKHVTRNVDGVLDGRDLGEFLYASIGI